MHHKLSNYNNFFTLFEVIDKIFLQDLKAKKIEGLNFSADKTLIFSQSSSCKNTILFHL